MIGALLYVCVWGGGRGGPKIYITNTLGSLCVCESGVCVWGGLGVCVYK